MLFTWTFFPNDAALPSLCFLCYLRGANSFLSMVVSAPRKIPNPFAVSLFPYLSFYYYSSLSILYSSSGSWWTSVTLLNQINRLPTIASRRSRLRPPNESPNCVNAGESIVECFAVQAPAQTRDDSLYVRGVE